MKKSFLLRDGIKELTFDELHDEFRYSIYSEANKMLSRYGSLFDRDEVEQQFLIELWTAYNKYDISRSMQVSTYIYHRFRNVQSTLFNEKVSKKDVEFFNSASSMEYMQSSENGTDSHEKGFDNDDCYNLNNYNTCPEEVILRNSIYDTLIKTLDDDSEKELFIVLSDIIEYPVALYAEKHGISRQAANNRLRKLKLKIKNIYEEEFAS